jgi:hypothetical protein
MGKTTIPDFFKRLIIMGIVPCPKREKAKKEYQQIANNPCPLVDGIW